MINFNLIKKILFFLYFYERKNTKLNNFIYISKGVNFRVLHGAHHAQQVPVGPVVASMRAMAARSSDLA